LTLPPSPPEVPLTDCCLLPAALDLTAF